MINIINNSIKNFVVFNSTIKHGQMNSAKPFYPGLEENPSERARLMREHKQALADEVGFDLNRLFMTLQPNAKHPSVAGTTYTLKPEDLANYSDLYDYDVWAHSVKLTRETPTATIGFNVSDGANVILMNLRTMEATSTFCSGEHINKGIPFMLASTLGGDPEDIVVDVSPFAYEIPFVKGELNEPTWVSNKKVWGNYLRDSEFGDTLYINQKDALVDQLVASGIKKENINLREDSLFNDNYYSSQTARLKNDPSLDGRFMHGVMYEFEDEEREYSEPYIRKYEIKR